eukprot:3587828-Pyramimonas_sp.AAC.1
MVRYSEPPQEGDVGVPLTVYNGCANSISCATSAAIALDTTNERRHMWQLWWFKVDQPATVLKVKAYRSLQEATCWDDG